MSDVFNIDFTDDNGAEALDLSDMLPGATPAVAAPPASTKQPISTTEPKSEVEDLLDLPDDGFNQDLEKEKTGNETPPSTSDSDVDLSDDDPKPHAEEQSSSPYSSLAKLFHEQGVISDSEGFDDVKSVDDFVEVFQSKIQDGILSEMTDDQKKYFEALKAGVPTQWYHDKTSVLNQLNNVQEEQLIADTDQAKNARYSLIYNDFISKGYEAEDAKQLASDQFQLGRDKDLSKKALNNAKARIQEQIDAEIAAKKAEQEAEVKTQQSLQEDIKEKVYNSKEIIPGMPLNKPMQDRVYNTATKIAGYDKQNRPLTAVFKALHEDPIDTQIRLAYLWTLTDGGKNMKTLVSKASSKVAKEVEEFITSGTIGQSGASNEKLPQTKSSRSMVESLAALGIGEKIQAT